MVLQYLSDVHTGRYAQRIQYDMYRFAGRQERHVLTCHNTGNDTLVTVTACHLIAFGNLTFLGNMYTNLFVYSRRQIIAVFTAEYLNADNLAGFAVRYTQGAVTYFTCFFTEDSTQQTFFCSQLGFAFRSNLTYQNIAGAYFGTDTDNTTLIQILQSFVGYVRNFAGNFFFTKLGIAGITIIFFNMNRCKDISLYQILVQQNSILVVIAFPRHISNDYVVT